MYIRESIQKYSLKFCHSEKNIKKFNFNQSETWHFNYLYQDLGSRVRKITFIKYQLYSLLDMGLEQVL